MERCRVSLTSVLTTHQSSLQLVTVAGGAGSHLPGLESLSGPPPVSGSLSAVEAAGAARGRPWKRETVAGAAGRRGGAEDQSGSAAVPHHTAVGQCGSVFVGRPVGAGLKQSRAPHTVRRRPGGIWGPLQFGWCHRLVTPATRSLSPLPGALIEVRHSGRAAGDFLKVRDEDICIFLSLARYVYVMLPMLISFLMKRK